MEFGRVGVDEGGGMDADDDAYSLLMRRPVCDDLTCVHCRCCCLDIRHGGMEKCLLETLQSKCKCPLDLGEWAARLVSRLEFDLRQECLVLSDASRFKVTLGPKSFEGLGANASIPNPASS